MRINRLTAVLFSIMLAGCNRLNQYSATTCSDATGLGALNELVTDKVKNDLTNEKGKDGSSLFEPANIRATLAMITLSVRDIRTTKADPNSTKVFCTGAMTISVPPALLKDATDSFELAETGDKIESVASKYELSASANSFSKDIDYALQPTDDRSSVFAETSDVHPIAGFIKDIVEAAIAKPMIQAAKAQAAQQSTGSILDSINQSNTGNEATALPSAAPEDVPTDAVQSDSPVQLATPERPSDTAAADAAQAAADAAAAAASQSSSNADDRADAASQQQLGKP